MINRSSVFYPIIRPCLLDKIQWRLTALWRQSTGKYPGITWSSLFRHILRRPDRKLPLQLRLEQSVSDNETIEVYNSPWGEFRIPKPGRQILLCLLRDIFLDREYENQYVTVSPGDTVVDCGAHVGVFARFALERGASRVIC